MIIAAAQFTIRDVSDPIVSGTEPSNKVDGMLWLDTSVSPNLLKKWNATSKTWDIVNDTADLEDDLRNEINNQISIVNADIEANSKGIQANVTALDKANNKISAIQSIMTPTGIYTLVSDSSGYKEQISEVKQQADRIESIVGRVDDLQTKIEQTDESITLSVSKKNATYYRDTEPENATAGDTWINPTTEKTYLAEGMTGKNLPEFRLGVITKSKHYLSYAFDDEADVFRFTIDENGNLLSSDPNVSINDNGELLTHNEWREVAPTELHTSYIDIQQDYIKIKSGGNVIIGAGGKVDVESGGGINMKSGSDIDIEAGANINIKSGGNINIAAGGTLDVNSGAAHFTTSDYTLSILASDGGEDTVLDFDAESKTLRVDEVNANNVRPYVAGITTVTASSIGGIDGLANMLSAARYEHVTYTQDYDEYATEPVLFQGCDTALVEILSSAGVRIPPLQFKGIQMNVWIEDVSWSCASNDAVNADSGIICVKNCTVLANNGMVASRHARITWIGADSTLNTVGSCTTAAFKATDGATIRAYGMIPTGALTKNTGGLIESIDTVVGGQTAAPTTEEVTVTLTATYGYYGTEAYWNAGELFQGYSNAKGQIYGCMKFTLPSDIESIISATLTLKAASSIGTGANVNVGVYGSATNYGSKPTLGTKYISKSNAVYAGSSCTLNATSAATALFNGTAKQLVLYTGETSVLSGKVYSKHYAKFSSAKLKITYQRSV